MMRFGQVRQRCSHAAVGVTHVETMKSPGVNRPDDDFHVFLEHAPDDVFPEIPCRRLIQLGQMDCTSFLPKRWRILKRVRFLEKN